MISVIIPVHNCEKWIARCIESILNNQGCELELILILNNSQDSSEDICRFYCNRNDCVHLIKADRGGVSHARNLGLQHAVGEYVAFVDSDDYIAPDYFDTLFNAAQDEKADIACCDFEWGNENQYDFSNEIAQYNFVGQDSFFYELYIKERQSYIVVWGKLYRRSLLNGILFDESLQVAEDKAYVSRAALKAEKIVFVHKKMYYYFLHGDSTCGNGQKDINVWYDSVRSLQKDVAWLRSQGKATYEGFSRCCLLRTADYYLKWSSRLNPQSEMTQELKSLIQVCEKQIVRDKHLSVKLKGRMMIEHYFPNQVQGLYRLKLRMEKRL